MTRKRTRRTDKITVRWDNPPGRGQGLTIERIVGGHTYRRDVPPNGTMTPLEAAKALQVTREFVYRLIWAGKLRTVKKRGKLEIPLSSIKAHKERRRKGRAEPFLTS